jgi:hypothetical protein
LFGDAVLAEDVALDDVGLGCFGDVGDAGGEEGVTVVDVTVFGEEADKALEGAVVSCGFRLGG